MPGKGQTRTQTFHIFGVLGFFYFASFTAPQPDTTSSTAPATL